MPTAALEKTNVIESNRYQLHFRRKSLMSGCSDGIYHQDVIDVTDTETSEKLSLHFRENTKKLVIVYRSENLRYLSFKEISPEEGSKAARWKQRSAGKNQLNFHEILFDDNGEVIEDYCSDKRNKRYYDFLDEQAFMPVLRDALMKKDDTELSSELQEMKRDMLDYLNHNITAPQQIQTKLLPQS